jgi:hypothetical protein
VQASPDSDAAENEKIKQIEEQYQLVSDRLQKQRLVMVNSCVSIQIPISLYFIFRPKKSAKYLQ